MKTKNKIQHLILAGLFGTTLASQAAGVVVYQSDFTGADLNSAGLYTQGTNGNWTLDTDNYWADGVATGSNTRAGLYNTDSWQNDRGMTLDVTWRNSAAMTRYSFGLVDAAWTTSGGVDWLNQSAAVPMALVFQRPGKRGRMDCTLITMPVR